MKETAAESHARIEREIVKEKAVTLGRAGERLEAALAAVAVIAPGCDEVVRDGLTGVLAKGDPTALAEAAIGLLLDHERRATMGARARAVAEREFDVRLQMDRTLAVYAAAREARRR